MFGKIITELEAYYIYNVALQSIEVAVINSSGTIIFSQHNIMIFDVWLLLFEMI
jgi:hypothetical protein